MNAGQANQSSTNPPLSSAVVGFEGENVLSPAQVSSPAADPASFPASLAKLFHFIFFRSCSLGRK